MSTKKQHYVPRVYLKAWETKVETTKEPTKQFDGVYLFENGATVAEGRTTETILWEPHLYTISFRQLYIADKCPKVYSYFVEKVYEAMLNNMLKQTFGTGNEVDDFMEAIWFTELYSMFFKNQGGFYNTALSMSVEKLQFILFEANHKAGTFITSDNPAFQHISHVETTNVNGYCFPISPQYFLFIAKGSEPVNYVDYRMADRLTVKKFNQIVASHSKNIIVASEKMRQNLF